MILKGLLSFIPALGLGWAILHWIWPGAWRRDGILKLGLSIAAGLGFSSALFFFWMLAFGPESRIFLLVETALAVILVGLTLHSLRRREAEGTWSGASAGRRLTWLLYALLAAALLDCAIYFVLYSLMSPNAHFDAWAIWNLRARQIVRAGAMWRDAFSPALDWSFHADYPLLLSLNTVIGWQLIGSETTRVPMLQAGLFALASVLILWGATAHYRGKNQAAIAALFLTVTPWFIVLSAYQIADQPLACYVLAGAVLLFMAIEEPPKFQWCYAALAGLMAGCAAWTKNEGILVGVGAILALLVLSGRRGQTLPAFISGALLPALAWLVFKLTLAPAGDLFAGQTVGMLAQRVIDPQRYWIILQGLAKNIFWFGRSPVPVLLVVIGYCLCLGWRSKKGLNGSLILLSVIFLGYCAVFVITPHPLQWHIDNSAERILFHLYPAVLWLVMMGVHTPEEASVVDNEKIPT